MNTTEIIGYLQTLEYENGRMKDDISALKENCVDTRRFYSVPVGVDMVARLHDVHPCTVRKYVQLKMIDTHPKSTDAKILIRASDALLLDFKRLQHDYRFRKHKLKITDNETRTERLAN